MEGKRARKHSKPLTFRKWEAAGQPAIITSSSLGLACRVYRGRVRKLGGDACQGGGVQGAGHDEQPSPLAGIRKINAARRGITSRVYSVNGGQVLADPVAFEACQRAPRLQGCYQSALAMHQVARRPVH